MEEKVSIEKLLREGKTVQFSPIGGSMIPLFVTPQDKVVVTPEFDIIKRLDVMVYRRPNGPLIIHRVYKVDEKGIYLVGDRQQEIEGPLSREYMLGKMVSFVRKGRACTVKNPIYRAYSWLWMLVRPRRYRIIKYTKLFLSPFLKLRKKGQEESREEMK